MSDKVLVSQVTNLDYKDLVSFLENFYSERNEKKWAERLEYWWEKNSAFNNDCFRGAKLVNDEDKKIVGFIGLIPLKANLKGSNEIAYAFTTWRVNENFRKYSLDLLYFIDKILDDKICFNFTANKIATFYFKKLKFQKIGKDNIKTYVHFNDSFFSMLFSKKKIPLFGSALDIIVKIFQSFPFPPFKNNNLHVVYKKNNYQDIDALWNDKINFTCIHRNSEFLRWLNENPIRKVLTFFIYNSDKILGYMTFLYVEERYKKLVCIDYFGELNNHIVSIVLSALKKILNKEKIDYHFIEIPMYCNNNLIKKLNLFSISRNQNRLIRIPDNLDQDLFSKVYYTSVEGGTGK